MDLQRFKSQWKFAGGSLAALLKLAEFDPGEYFITSYFQLIDNGDELLEKYFDDAELGERFFVFAEDCGSLFASWLVPDGNDSGSLPIVFLSRNFVGSQVIANKTEEFIALLALGADDFDAAFQSIAQDGPWIGKKRVSDTLTRFREWAKHELHLAPTEHPESAIRSAAQGHPDLLEWMKQLPAFRPYVPRQQTPRKAESAEDALRRFAAIGESYYHEAHVNLGFGHPVHLLVSMADADPAEFSDVLNRVRDGISRIVHRERDIRVAATRDLQLEASQYPSLETVDADRDLRLSSMTFFPDGSASLMYGVGGAIGDRMVEIWFGPDGSIGTPSIGD